MPRGQSLSQGASHILALLAASDAMTIRELHEGLAHKRSTLTSILDRLVARGFVTRDVGKSDRRTFVVSLTERGRRVAATVFQNLANLERAVKARVSEVDIAGFSRVLAAIEEGRRTCGQLHPPRRQPLLAAGAAGLGPDVVWTYEATHRALAEILSPAAGASPPPSARRVRHVPT